MNYFDAFLLCIVCAGFLYNGISTRRETERFRKQVFEQFDDVKDLLDKLERKK